MLRQRLRWSAPDLRRIRRVCFARALRHQCPQCGRGRLFARWARLSERCEVCGLIFRREDGAELGSMYLSATVSQVFAALVFAGIWIATDWSFGPAFLLGAPLVIAFCYGFLPLSMSMWTAIEYLTDVANCEWWAQPRV